MIGKEIGRIVYFVICNGYCRICDSVKKLRKILLIYDCCRNWMGSLKVMELDMCIGLLKDLGEKDV